MKAGAAEADITPDFAVELSGFALRTQPAVGVLEPPPENYDYTAARAYIVPPRARVPRVLFRRPNCYHP